MPDCDFTCYGDAQAALEVFTGELVKAERRQLQTAESPHGGC